ncbi:MAG: aminotransferase class V-fold PLP-dependent enzyme [Myxacorys californica WJT36-NPBG1]|nr:aminotransferase class V-fold PLP-dependent enzyme [Myxacorys californica WJT36-NPBG1]
MQNLRDDIQFAEPSNRLIDVMALFSRSETTLLTEQELETRVDAIVQAFVNAKTISTDIDLATIADQFTDSQIPLTACNVDQYFNELTSSVISHSIHTSSPQFIGHMTTALPYFVRPLGKLMTAMNQNVVKVETAKTFSFYERQALAMLHRLIYGCSDDFYSQHIQASESTLGILTTGGTLANITALWCARNVALKPQAGFAGVEQEGLLAALEFYGYKGAVIIGSSLMHYSFEKAAGLLGIGDRHLLKIPVDHNHRMNLQALRKTIAECRDRKQLILAIVGIAGSTESGSIDPLAEIAAIAREAKVHFHVDAAWGGPVLFSEQHAHKLAGIEDADSVTIDGHKQLYLPMGIGMVLLRNPHLAALIEKNASYTVRKDSIDLGKRSIEGSRPGMILFLQAALKLIGQQGYAVLIDAGIQKTQYLANQIRQRPEFELLLEPEMNLLLYRYIPKPFRQKLTTKTLTEVDQRSINDFNELLQNAQRQAGKTFISRTTLSTSIYGQQQAIVALRAVIVNPLSTEADIDAVLADQLQTAAQLPVVVPPDQMSLEVTCDCY